MFEMEFERLLNQYRDAIGIRSRFSGLVKDFFPGQQMQINLVLAAYDLGLSHELETVRAINNAFAYRFVKRLVEEYGISRANADWVVSVWCVCYGQHILGKPCEIKISSEKKGVAPVIREEKTGTTQYGELFQYEQSVLGNGLAVSGFTGINNKTIIFQNMSKNLPVVEIKAGAFSESTIEEAIMTEGFRKIGEKAFLGCVNLKQVIFPMSLHEIGDFALAGCVSLKTTSLPMMLEQIGNYVFSGTGLKTISIPKTVYWIGEGAFSDCKSLDHVEIRENINSIPAKMFQGCENLKDIKLHEQLSGIGDFCFANCMNLASVYVPDSVTSIGENAFQGVNEKFILECSFGSYAERYARKKKIKYQLV